MARDLIVAALLLAMTAGPVAAQGKGSIEFGFDFGVTYQMYGDDSYSDDAIYVGVPGPAFGGLSYISLQTVRAGFFVMEKSQIETTFGFALSDGDDDKFTQLGLGADWLQNFGDVKASPVPYVKFGGAIKLIDFVSDSNTQGGLKGGGGLKLMVADRFAVRFEGGLMRWFESDWVDSHTDIYGSVGLSLFTK